MERLIERATAALADAAVGATSRDELRRVVLGELNRLVGFDFGIAWSLPESQGGSTLVGFEPKYWRYFYDHRGRFLAELAPLVAQATRSGVVDDLRAFDERTRDRLGFYQEIIRPIGSRNYLTVMLGARGRGASVMQIGRGGRHASPFGEEQLAALGRLLPVLSLGEALHDAPPVADHGLTARERQIVSYVALGFTNREIAMACGTSAHTVHNQLKRIFAKVDVCNRAELVGIAMGEGLIERGAPGL